MIRKYTNDLIKMPKQKPVLLVCGCEKYRTNLIAGIKRFKSPYWITVGCIGRPELSSPQYNDSEKIVYLPAPDTYEGLPSKIWQAFTWIMDTWPGTQGIFKTDEDIWFDKPRELVKAILENLNTPFWGIHIDTVESGNILDVTIEEQFTDKTLRPTYKASTYCFGHGYWISKTMFPAIRDAKCEYETSYLEDVCTGVVMNSVGVYPKHVPLEYCEMPRVKEKPCQP